MKYLIIALAIIFLLGGCWRYSQPARGGGRGRGLRYRDPGNCPYRNSMIETNNKNINWQVLHLPLNHNILAAGESITETPIA